MEKNAVSLRKGVWSKEEDILLTKCIEKYGEGRWHLVPLRAGVNRCRKSCRLRWLNYLSPNIKRGSFAGDEIDLLVRLHKLLGNRWSLIAGRIPGRTANDVKNFWNTYMADKKKPSPPPPPATDGETIVTKSNNMIIKPRPSRKLQAPPCPLELIISPDTDTNKQLDEKNKSLDDQLMVPAQSEEGGDECMRWWSSLLDINENENMSGGPFLFPEDEPRPIPNTISHDHDANIIDGLSDIELLDADLWDLLSMDNN